MTFVYPWISWIRSFRSKLLNLMGFIRLGNILRWFILSLSVDLVCSLLFKTVINWDSSLGISIVRRRHSSRRHWFISETKFTINVIQLIKSFISWFPSKNIVDLNFLLSLNFFNTIFGVSLWHLVLQVVVVKRIVFGLS